MIMRDKNANDPDK